MAAYVPHPYPKSLFRPDGACKIATDAAHHESLSAEGWLTADEIDAQGMPKDAAGDLAESPDADSSEAPKRRGRKPKDAAGD